MKITVVGIGPGSLEDMTGRAVAALSNADVIVGYAVYTALVKPHFQKKRYIETGMCGEEERCLLAVEEAQKGYSVCVICGGDAGVYGLAGLVLTLANERQIPVEVVPGVTALLGGAALLGAPLIHDFAAISLSDLLTPWEVIEKRLEAVAMADFVICLYNPMSHKRRGHLGKACEIILRYRGGGTPCGLARNIGRPMEASRTLTLIALKDTEVDMFTTVFIGNSRTRVESGKLITPRGYREVNA